MSDKPDSRVSAEERILSGQAWDDFCDELKSVGRLLSNEGCPTDAYNRALGYRALTHWLRAGLEMGFDYADPQFPAFYRLADDTKKMGNDNPDNIYLNCVVDGGFDYVIRGHRGTIDWFSVNSKASATSIADMKDTGRIDSTQLQFDDDGHFEIKVSTKRQAGNWLPMTAGTRQLIVRQTFGDRKVEQAAEMTIECLNATREHNSLQVEQFEPALARATTFLRTTTEWTNDWMGIFNQHVNQLPDDDQARCIASGGDPDIRYYQSSWKLAEDEALLIHLVDIPECQTWNFQLSNAWMESLDFRFFRISINKHTAHYEPDGSVKIVVSSQAPRADFKNWLWTSGHTQGSMLGRLVKASQFLTEFPTKVVKVSEL